MLLPQNTSFKKKFYSNITTTIYCRLGLEYWTEWAQIWYDWLGKFNDFVVIFMIFVAESMFRPQRSEFNYWLRVAIHRIISCGKSGAGLTESKSSFPHSNDFFLIHSNAGFPQKLIFQYENPPNQHYASQFNKPFVFVSLLSDSLTHPWINRIDTRHGWCRVCCWIKTEKNRNKKQGTREKIKILTTIEMLTQIAQGTTLYRMKEIDKI